MSRRKDKDPREPNSQEGSQHSSLEPSQHSSFEPSVELSGPIPASNGARVLLGLGVCIYLGFYIFWSLRNYETFGMFGFDFGIHDQAVWLLSRGQSPFITVSGQYYFADHLYWIILALVPLYWIVPSAKVLLVVQTLALGLAAVPAFLVARVKLRSEWLACGLACAYLLNPYIGWVNLDQFHPDVFAVPLVFLAFLFILRRRWRLFLAMVVLLMLVKEDVALLVIGIGVWVAVLHNRKVGIVTSALAAVWMLISFRVLLPVLSGTGSLANYLAVHSQRIPFGGIGGLLKTLVTEPWEVVAAAFTEGRALYYLQVFGPLGFLPFLSPSTLLAVILPLVANGLSTFWYQHSIEYHYGALVVPGLVVAAVFGVAHGSVRVRRIMVIFVLVTAVVGLYLCGPAQGSRNPGPWNQWPEEFTDAVHEAVALIPPEAVVSADWHFVALLTHRTEIYEFPNPWSAFNWGDRQLTGKPLPERIARVEYILLRREMSEQYQEVFDQVEASGEFRTILDKGGVMLLKRGSGSLTNGSTSAADVDGRPGWMGKGWMGKGWMGKGWMGKGSLRTANGC